MPNLNRVFLLGRTTRDPEVRYTPKGMPVAELGLAVNRIWTEDGEKHEDTTFVDVTLWGRQAEVAGQYLCKGSPVFIEGRLQLDSWEDRQTGQKRSKLKVVCERLQLLSGRPQGSTPPPSRSPQKANVPQPARPAGVREPEPDDAVPF